MLNNKKGGVALQILIILIIIVLVSALVLSLVKFGLINPKENNVNVLNTEFIPVSDSGFLTLRDFKFCNYIDTKFKCFNENNTFNIGDNIYLNFLVESSTYNSEVTLTRNYAIKDSSGRVYLELDKKNSYQFTTISSKEREKVSFADFFMVTNDFKSGEYVLDVIIENPLLNNKITAKKIFTIK